MDSHFVVRKSGSGESNTRVASEEERKRNVNVFRRNYGGIYDTADSVALEA